MLRCCRWTSKIRKIRCVEHHALMQRSIYSSISSGTWTRESRTRNRQTEYRQGAANITFDPGHSNRRSLPHSSPPGWVRYRFLASWESLQWHRRLQLKTTFRLFSALCLQVFTETWSSGRMLMSNTSLWSRSHLTKFVSLSLVELESGLRLGSSRSYASLLMNADERPGGRARHSFTSAHREVHGALFVQTISDVAQGHQAQFARISIVVDVASEGVFGGGREREREKGMFSMYTFALRRKTSARAHKRERLRTDRMHRNSNNVASFSVPNAPPSARRFVWVKAKERSCWSIGDRDDDDDDGVSTEQEKAHVEKGRVRTRWMDELSLSLVLLSPYSPQKSSFLLFPFRTSLCSFWCVHSCCLG